MSLNSTGIQGIYTLINRLESELSLKLGVLKQLTLVLYF